MKDAVAILVKIGLIQPGNLHDHPNWNLLPLATEGPVEAHQYVKWKYDHSCGHVDNDPDHGSPCGMWLGMQIVSPRYAKEAMELFNKGDGAYGTDRITVMTEAEVEDFYDNRHAVRMGEAKQDEGILTALAAEISLREQLGDTVGVEKAKEDARKALDKDDVHPGVRRNTDRHWADFKTKNPEFNFLTKAQVEAL